MSPSVLSALHEHCKLPVTQTGSSRAALVVLQEALQAAPHPLGSWAELLFLPHFPFPLLVAIPAGQSQLQLLKVPFSLHHQQLQL